MLERAGKLPVTIPVIPFLGFEDSDDELDFSTSEEDDDEGLDEDIEWLIADDFFSIVENNETNSNDTNNNKTENNKAETTSTKQITTKQKISKKSRKNVKL